jgi:hypothetical protein
MFFAIIICRLLSHSLYYLTVHNSPRMNQTEKLWAPHLRFEDRLTWLLTCYFELLHKNVAVLKKKEIGLLYKTSTHLRFEGYLLVTLNCTKTSQCSQKKKLVYLQNFN